MHHMSRRQRLEFVRTGKLAITRATGGPHVTPSWFDIDETPTGATTVKALRNRP